MEPTTWLWIGLMIAGAAALLAGLMTGRPLVWRFGLIVAVLAICTAGLHPRLDANGRLQTNLKLGLDLAGGTSLLYSVNTEGSLNAQDAINKTIEALKRRIDPEGVRNLTWREEAGSRIEVQMPRPTEEVQQRRKTLDDIENKIREQNVSQAQIAALLKLDGEKFDQAVGQLTGDAPVAQSLRQLKAAHDKLAAIRAEYDAAKEDANKRIELAEQVNKADGPYEDSLGQLLRRNVNTVELRQVLNRPDKAAPGSAPDAASPRKQGLDQMLADHPARADEIKQFVAAYEAYQQNKGQLDDPNDLIRLLKGQGVLEFRITANNAEAPNAEELRRQLTDKGPGSFAGQQMIFVQIDDPTMFAEKLEERDAMRRNPAEYFGRQGLIGAGYGDNYYILCWNTLDKSMTRRAEQAGWKVEQVNSTADENYLPAVFFALNPVGSHLMSNMTAPNVGRQMAMILDGRVLSAPRINSRLGGSITITRSQGFSQQEQQYLINTLQAGSLQARLSPEPISIRTVGPNLGADNLKKGLTSARDAMILVCLFMICYYFFAGAVADLALAANIIIILGIMSIYQASFTLPGIAGIVLTIGMAVDANVLIYERIREELNRGVDMETALRLGYEKALSAIIDGNLTNLIVCVILYYTATVEVRGFAVTLGIGILATLFTALFMTRAIFYLWYGLFGFHRKMNMLPMTFKIIDRAFTPAIRWIRLAPVFMTVSAVLILAGVVLMINRGNNMLDIEFRSGTEIAFELAPAAGATPRKSLTIQEARERIASLASVTGLEDMKDATVVSLGEPVDGNRFTGFSVACTVEDAKKVSDQIKQKFADVLNVQSALKFEDMDIHDYSPDKLGSLVRPVTRPQLGEVIGQNVPGNVTEYRGGVAVLVRHIEPAATLADIERRVKAMRLQPDFDAFADREVKVYPVTAAAGSVDHYSAAAIIVADPRISYFNNPGAWEQMAGKTWEFVTAALVRDTSLSKVSNFTPTVARTLRDKAVVATLLSLLAIMAYIWFRFGSLRHGVAATAALVHDTFIALGAIAAAHFLAGTALGDALLLGEFKINLGVIAAILTLIGYSLNDTIVVFDRIRENRGKLAVASTDIIDMSINQTISRTILTSGTTLMAIIILYIFGGEAIRGFAFVLLVGVIVGTYSSIAIASPLLLYGNKLANKLNRDKPAAKPELAKTPV
ncbi:MAG: protein translocase subunit SecD [Phycisphaerales bacterium]